MSWSAPAWVGLSDEDYKKMLQRKAVAVTRRDKGVMAGLFAGLGTEHQVPAVTRLFQPFGSRLKAVDDVG